MKGVLLSDSTLLSGFLLGIIATLVYISLRPTRQWIGFVAIAVALLITLFAAHELLMLTLLSYILLLALIKSVIKL
jgi:hypothetical protein